jgi:hypothetical protein
VEELLVAVAGRDPRFPDGDGELGTLTQRERRDAVPTDVTIRSRAVRLLEYLEAIQDLCKQPVRDVTDYQDRCWWAEGTPAHPSCAIAATGDKLCLTASRPRLPLVPPVREDVAPYLQTKVNDPEKEPAFVTDFDDAFADDPGKAARHREPQRGHVEGSWLSWTPHHGRRCRRGSPIKTYATFAYGFRVIPCASTWCGAVASSAGPWTGNTFCTSAG